MADQFLAEQHSWTLIHQARTNVEDSWVMLTQDGDIIPIPGEKILHTSRHRVGLELTTPRELQVAEPFHLKSDSGIAYITNERIIYLPARPTEDFRSFFAPVLNFTDTHVQSSWIGPWCWHGVVKPVLGGGIPVTVPRLDAKFVFRDGGHSDFQQKFEWLKERLLHAQELGILPGRNVEPPPPYDLNPPAATASPSSGTAAGAAAAAAAGSGGVGERAQPPPPAPNEPPPDYVEAQAQALSVQYEQRMREEAERG